MSDKYLYEIKPESSDTIEKVNEELAKYVNITYFGVQGKPGIQFSINDAGTITIGNSGSFQIDLTYSEIPTIEKIKLEGNNASWSVLPLIIHLVGRMKEGSN